VLHRRSNQFTRSLAYTDATADHLLRYHFICTALANGALTKERVMSEINWTPLEKKLARRIFDQALETELAATLAEFKAKVAALSDPHAMWEFIEFLRTRGQAIDRKYDYRYSQLVIVFAVLLREGRIAKEDLTGLSAEKRALIDRILAY
jgi:hypothetical protein